MKENQSFSVIAAMREHRFAILLVFLTLMMLFEPVKELLRLPRVAASIFLTVIFAIMLISAVFAVIRSKKSMIFGLALAVPTVALAIYHVAPGGGPIVLLAYHLFAICFLGYVIIALLKYFFVEKIVTINVIFAALCNFLLMGILWALVYSIVCTFDAAAFSLANQIAGDGEPFRFGSESTGLAIYYSFVTMTTLGYGDVTPVSSAARSLAVIQAVVGQMYLTVLVARLVGMHVAQASNR